MDGLRYRGRFNCEASGSDLFILLKTKMAVGVVPMVVITGFWAIVGILIPFFVPKGPNRGLIQLMLPLTAICCWLFWLCAYLAQINPLMGPAIHTNILAILQKEWPYTPVKS